MVNSAIPEMVTPVRAPYGPVETQSEPLVPGLLAARDVEADAAVQLEWGWIVGVDAQRDRRRTARAQVRNACREHHARDSPLAMLGMDREIGNPGARITVRILLAGLVHRVAGGDDSVRRVDAEQHAFALPVQ